MIPSDFTVSPKVAEVERALDQMDNNSVVLKAQLEKRTKELNARVNQTP